MMPAYKDEVLFDDYSALQQIIGNKQPLTPALNANCDCAGYTATKDDEDVDPRKITLVADQAR